VQITLNPAFPASLWVAFRDDLVLEADALFADMDAESVLRRCHKLAGSAGVYGVVVLRQAAVALQESGTPLTDAPARDRLRRAVTATVDAVDAHVE